MSDSTKVTLITDEHDVALVSHTTEFVRDAESDWADITAKFQVNVGTSGIVLDFSVFEKADDDEALSEAIQKEGESLRKFVREVMDFQNRFEEMSQKALKEAHSRV